MKKEIVEGMATYWGSYVKDEIQIVRDFVKEDILENGTRVFLENEELYFKKIKFNTDGGTNTREWIEQSGKEVDLKSMTDDEIWSYIYGEYIMKGELGKIDGFGSTQVDSY